MTYEETLKHFKSLQKRYTREHNGKMCEKVALAIEALEKQIPKKPELKNHFHICPACKAPTVSDYCGRCGQALDWEGN